MAAGGKRSNFLQEYGPWLVVHADNANKNEWVIKREKSKRKKKEKKERKEGRKLGRGHDVGMGYIEGAKMSCLKNMFKTTIKMIHVHEIVKE